MIKRETVEGRPAVVAYINDEFEPVSADDATMVKVMFDDGEIVFGVKAEPDRSRSQWRRARARAQALLKG